MNSAKTVFLVTVVLLVGGILLLRRGSEGGRVSPAKEPGARGTGKQPLVLYCAAGIKPPVEAVAKEYEQLYGTPIQLQFGGSGTLLSNFKLAQKGDLFLAADESYIRLARSNHLVAESLPLARMKPVIGVQKGNPKNIRTVADLLRPDVRTALANPDAASIGKLTRELLQKSGHWEALQAKAKVFKPTVTEVANDVLLAAVDAGILWDATVNQHPELEMVTTPALDEGGETITIGILEFTKRPTDALRFARYLGARDKGLVEFKKFGYAPVDGDVWAEHPRVVLFSGGVNRIAIEETIKAFEQREGVDVSRVYNGCGILLSQLRAGQRPDAYFACDVSFMTQVTDLFLDSINVSQTDIVLLVQKGNPKGLRSLADLARPGLKIGVGNPQQSTLGALTKQLLEGAGLLEKVMENVRSQTPTADLLVNQCQTGSLDAVVVYEANTSQIRDKLDLVRVDHPLAKAVQPIAVARKTDQRYLTERLSAAIRSAASKTRFESLGFHWLAPLESP